LEPSGRPVLVLLELIEAAEELLEERSHLSIVLQDFLEPEDPGRIGEDFAPAQKFSLPLLLEPVALALGTCGSIRRCPRLL
jgi:hypothetical protein